MRRKKDTASVISLALRVEVWAAAVITAGVLMGIIACILYNGIPGIVSEELFSVGDSADKASLMPAMVNTAIMTGMSLGMALPMGVCAAVYLAEYSGKERIGVKIIRLTAETLAGIPSIDYGLFGYMLFVITLRWGYSLLSGAATLAVMRLPLIMRTTEDALLSVPQAYREGSMGLGAGKSRTIFRIIIPAALPGITAGVILAAGRIAGESAALIFTAGTGSRIAKGVFSSTRTLSVHMYALLTEGIYEEQAYGTALVLLVLTGGLNAISAAAAKRFSRI